MNYISSIKIINLSQIIIMGVLCYAKVLIFTLVLLLVDFTNLAKADSLQIADKVYNYDSYEYYPHTA